MFPSKKQKKIEVPTIETRTVTVPTAQGLKDMITPAVAAAKDYTTETASNVGDWARPRLEAGKEMAEKQASNAKDRMDSTPKLQDLLASGAEARGVAAQRSRDAALVLKGEAVAKPVKKKGGFLGFLATLGVLAVIGGAAAVVVQKFTQPKDDPWARPLTDPYVAPATGRDSTVAGGTGVQVSEVGDQATDSELAPPEGQVPTIGDKTRD